MRTIAVSILVTLLAFVYCSSRIWRHVPDPVIDFGREVYVAWRVAEGEPLYTHLTYINGPLSPYVNAMLFKITGPSLAAIKWFNLFIALGVLAMLWVLIRRIAGDLVAMVCGVSWCMLFGFAILNNDPTFNFLTPYSHDLTHGFALAMGMMLVLDRAFSPSPPYSGERAGVRGDASNTTNAEGPTATQPLTPTLSPLSTKGRGSLMFGGLLFGLILLTNPEIVLASSAAMIVGVALGRKSMHCRALIAMGTGIAIPVAIAWGLLSLKIGAREALFGMLGGFRWIGESRFTDMPLYKWVSGQDQASSNLWAMVRWGMYWIGSVAVFAGAGWRARSRSRETVLGVASSLMIVSFACSFFWRSAMPWPLVFRGLPVVVVAMIAIAWHPRLLPKPRDPLLLMLLVFSLVLLAKICLAVRITHYGFVLAAPACLVSLAMIGGPIAERLGRGAMVLRLSALGVWAMVLVMYVQATDAWTGKLNQPLQTPQDGIILTDGTRANAITRVLEQGELHMSKGDTLACVPDGALLNVLLRKVNPTGHAVLIPGEMLMFGEQRITNDFMRHQPDWIVVTHRDLALQGSSVFGGDFAQALGIWIDMNYEPVAQFGDKPFTTGRYGIVLMRRRDLPASQNTR